MKGWGKNKIRMHLIQKKVPAQLMQEYLQNVEETEYLDKLKELASNKLERVKAKNDYEKKAKVFRYLQQKGFESSLIHEVLFSK